MRRVPLTTRSWSSQDFQHEPLDSDPTSIRLVQVLADLSQSSRVQCSMIHGTTSDSYVCLSYVWGPWAEDSTWIDINGLTCAVQPNLWHFLNSARSRYADLWLWIDALCINQTDLVERNQQVQQMGQIYSRASLVLSWLGNHSDITWLFRQASRARQRYSHRNALISNQLDYAPASRMRTLIEHNLREPVKHLGTLDYWKRAWITQELALARQSIFVAGEEQVDLDILLVLLGKPAMQVVHATGLLRPMLSVLPDRVRTQAMKEKGLVELLYLYRDRDCGIRRDRIFSLLALCREGADLTVDYKSSDADLLLHILEVCRHSLCFCAVNIVADAIGIREIPSHRLALLEDDLTEIDGRSITRTSDMCQQCRTRLPDTLTPKVGELFCMRTLCPNFEGHIVWGSDDTRQNAVLYYGLLDSIAFEWQFPAIGGMSGVNPIEGSDTFRLRFSLGLMLRIARMEPVGWSKEHQNHQADMVLCGSTGSFPAHPTFSSI